jgi:hypothetical protein
MALSTKDVVACWLVLGTGRGGGPGWDPTRARVSALRTLDALGTAAWTHLHRALLRPRHPETLCALAHAVALASLHHQQQRGAGGTAGLQGVCAGRVAAMVFHARCPGTPPPQEVVMALACQARTPQLPREVWAWLASALDHVGTKEPGASDGAPHPPQYPAGCIRQVLGLMVQAGPAVVASLLSPRALLAVQALGEPQEAGVETEVQVLAGAVLHARAVAVHLSTAAARREQAKQALAWLPSPVRTRMGALTADHALQAVPRCVVCTGRAIEDVPLTAWRVLPCACMLHAACFDAWASANTKFWDRTACLCCCANLAQLVSRTLLAP